MLDGLKKPKSKGKKKEEVVDAASSDIEIIESKPDSKKEEGDGEEKPAPSLDDVDMVDEDVKPSSTASPSGSVAVPTSKPSEADDDLPDPSTLLRPSPSPAPMTTISNAAIVCEHGMLDPKKAESMKWISQEGVTALKELGVALEPELMTPRDFCRDCVEGIAAGSSLSLSSLSSGATHRRFYARRAEFLYDRKHPADTEACLEADKQGDRSVSISRAWYTGSSALFPPSPTSSY